MSWRLAKKIPEGIFFGCAGNPHISIKSLPICSCANTYEKHLQNYKKYLFHKENYIELEIKREEAKDIQGYYIFYPTKYFEYPKELK